MLCRHYGIENIVVDVGVDYEFENLPNLVARKVKRGTENFLEQPAMTEGEAIRALQVGIDCGEGYDLIGSGDMGIGNTTSSAAILAVIAGLPVEQVVGRASTGIDDERLHHKINVIKEAIQRRKPDPQNGLDVLTKIGGLEIAAIAGLILGAAISPHPGGGRRFYFRRRRDDRDNTFAKFPLVYFFLASFTRARTRSNDGSLACPADSRPRSMHWAKAREPRSPWTSSQQRYACVCGGGGGGGGGSVTRWQHSNRRPSRKR